MFNIPDVDLDLNQETRDMIIKSLKNIPASKINDKGIFPHGIGVYFCNIPMDKISGLSSIDYKSAEENYGYIKTDLLHNTVYDSFKTRSELFDCMNKPINWKMLYKEDILTSLPHINNYYTLINQMPKIDSIEKLAMFIAIVRPAKKYLIDYILKSKDWNSIKDKIWIKEKEGYMYKKSHAISYALMITIALRKLEC